MRFSEMSTRELRRELVRRGPRRLSDYEAAQKLFDQRAANADRLRVALLAAHPAAPDIDSVENISPAWEIVRDVIRTMTPEA